MTKIISSISEFIEYRRSLPHSMTIGFVPTMGALHLGHLSLVEASVKENEITIVSIFVNPKQFGANEDLSKYPRDIEKDIKLLITKKVDIIFTPEYSDIYPENYLTYTSVNKLSRLHCGKSRPGHFRGVTTIVNKLINLSRPDFMYLGEKDYQQIIVLEKMMTDLNIPTKIKRCPIIRETDGLAMSSRNIYLSTQDRINATCLYRALILAQELYTKGFTSVARVKTQMADLVTRSNGLIDYIAFVDKNTLQKEKTLSPSTRVLMAVKIGNTRLIDNMNII